MASRTPLLQISKTATRFAFSSPRSSSTPTARFASTLRPKYQRPLINHPPSSHLSHYSAATGDPVQPPDYLDEGERKVFDLIKEGLEPAQLTVQDISGGCGSMYGIDIVSEKFKGLSVIKQHRLVNSVLGDEIKKWHGVQLKTKAP